MTIKICHVFLLQTGFLVISLTTQVLPCGNSKKFDLLLEVQTREKLLSYLCDLCSIQQGFKKDLVLHAGFQLV